jgi:hypothetical protein
MSEGQRGITRSTREKENELKLEINLEFKNQNALVSSLWGKCPKDKGGSHVAPKKKKMNSNWKLISNSKTQNVRVSSLWGKCPKDKGGLHVAPNKRKIKETQTGN